MKVLNFVVVALHFIGESLTVFACRQKTLYAQHSAIEWVQFD